MAGDKTFNIIGITEGPKMRIEDWQPKVEGYSSVSDIIKEIRDDVDQQLARQMLTTMREIPDGNKIYRFFNRDLGGVGVMIFDIKDGIYFPGSLVEYLNMSPGGAKLEGVEAVADYYSQNPDIILNSRTAIKFNK